MTEPGKSSLAQMATEMAATRGLKPSAVYGMLAAVQALLKTPDGRYLLTSLTNGLTAREAIEDIGRMVSPPPAGAGEEMRGAIEKAQTAARSTPPSPPSPLTGPKPR